MNVNTAEPDLVLTGFRIATMALPRVEFACEFSKRSIIRSSQHVDYGLIENVSIGIRAGKVQWFADSASLPKFEKAKTIDGNGQLLTPGLIDCHTHLVYGGNRADEWEKRLTGVSYEQIAREGGGILSSVKATRAATKEELIESASKRLARLLAEGVTTVEIKSGYGLDLESESKMLAAATELAKRFPVHIEPTLLAAHATPPEFNGTPQAYIDHICEKIIPALKDQCTSVDVFCESIAFDLRQTRQVFESAQSFGLNIKVHAEQLTSNGGAALAAAMGALSADHLEYLSDESCQKMAESEIVGTLLPGAFYCLNETQKPPVEAMRRHNIPMAVATDANPGSSPVTSILLAANMACNLFGLSPAESLAGITRNAAQALGLQNSIGTIEVGKMADLVVWDVDSPAEIVYGLGHNPSTEVLKSGQLVRGS